MPDDKHVDVLDPYVDEIRRLWLHIRTKGILHCALLATGWKRLHGTNMGYVQVERNEVAHTPELAIQKQADWEAKTHARKMVGLGPGKGPRPKRRR